MNPTPPRQLVDEIRKAFAFLETDYGYAIKWTHGTPIAVIVVYGCGAKGVLVGVDMREENYTVEFVALDERGEVDPGRTPLSLNDVLLARGKPELRIKHVDTVGLGRRGHRALLQRAAALVGEYGREVLGTRCEPQDT